jgi:superfamily II DNA or RNA helicase
MLLNEFNELKEKGFLKNDGFYIKYSNIKSEVLEKLKKLTTIPYYNSYDYNKKCFYKCYKYIGKYLKLPRYYALKIIGIPNKILLKRGEYWKNDLQTIYPPRDYQVGIINDTYKYMKKLGGSIITVQCGLGKTYMAIKIATLIKQKTLIMVHTSVLADQWKERINYFVPNATVGLIQASRFDIDKDFVIAMIQTVIRRKSTYFKPKQFESFGLTIYDECHHMAARSFARSIPLVTSKYNLGLSATPKRTDKLENIFYWNIGYTVHEKTTNEREAISKSIHYTDDNYQYKYNWKGDVDLHQLHMQIINNEYRNEVIHKQIINLSSCGRKLLVLSKFIDHLRYMKMMFERKTHYKKYPKEILYQICLKNKINKKSFSLICSYLKTEITCGLYIGGMRRTCNRFIETLTREQLKNIIINNKEKITDEEDLKKIYTKKRTKILSNLKLKKMEEIKMIDKYKMFYISESERESLEKSENSDVIFATYSLVSEGIDIPTLNTLIMTTPKREIEQIIGRILRGKTKKIPLIMDIVDENFRIYQNQGYARKVYYKKHKYPINIQYLRRGDNIPIIDEEYKIDEEEKKKKIDEKIYENFNKKCLL